MIDKKSKALTYLIVIFQILNILLALVSIHYIKSSIGEFSQAPKGEQSVYLIGFIALGIIFLYLILVAAYIYLFIVAFDFIFYVTIFCRKLRKNVVSKYLNVAFFFSCLAAAAALIMLFRLAVSDGITKATDFAVVLAFTMGFLILPVLHIIQYFTIKKALKKLI